MCGRKICFGSFLFDPEYLVVISVVFVVFGDFIFSDAFVIWRLVYSDFWYFGYFHLAVYSDFQMYLYL